MSSGAYVEWRRPRVVLTYHKDPRTGTWRELTAAELVDLAKAELPDVEPPDEPREPLTAADLIAVLTEQEVSE